MKDVNAFVTSETIYPYSNNFSVNQNIFSTNRKIWASKENEYLKSNESIHDYSPIKIIKKGNPIRVSDLKKRTVIRTGNITPVILISNGLTIKTTGQAKGSGDWRLYRGKAKKQKSCTWSCPKRN